jgi:hypothetical protein
MRIRKPHRVDKRSRKNVDNGRSRFTAPRRTVIELRWNGLVRSRKLDEPAILLKLRREGKLIFWNLRPSGQV